MHELIGRIVADLGGDRAAADQAVRFVLPFRCGEWNMNVAAAMMGRTHGARTSTRQSHLNSSFEGAAADIRSAAAGSAMGAIPAVDRGTVGHARQMVGENAVGDGVGAVPGRFV